MLPQEMRTFGALKAESPAADAVERLTDRALHAAAVNPDHSAAGRAAALHSLSARHISMTPWRVRVESFLRAEDFAAGDALFFRGARRWFSALVGLTLALAIGLGAWRLTWSPGLDLRAIATLAGAAAVAYAFWFAASVVRAKPARICLLGGDDVALRRMMRLELRPYGHVARLDAPHAAQIRSAAGYRALARRLDDRVRLNFAAAVSPHAAAPVAANASWRPLVRQLLSDSSDAIVIDLSEGGEGLDAVTSGEIAASRCVFVTLWGRIDEAEAALRQAGLDAPCFFYAPDGEMQRRAGFRAALLQAMRATHGVA